VSAGDDSLLRCDITCAIFQRHSPVRLSRTNFRWPFTGRFRVALPITLCGIADSVALTVSVWRSLSVWWHSADRDRDRLVYVRTSVCRLTAHIAATPVGRLNAHVLLQRMSPGAGTRVAAAQLRSPGAYSCVAGESLHSLLLACFAGLRRLEPGPVAQLGLTE